MVESIVSLFSKLLYYLECGLCKIVFMMEQMFNVFSGVSTITYNKEPDVLINVFFYNTAVSNIYWGMAIIGIALSFGFTIFAVTRKLFDAGGRIQQSLGQIITEQLKSIFIILSMSIIMSVVLDGTSILLTQVNYLFSDPYGSVAPQVITYTGEQYAAMGRVLSTIGNYSMNPSYSSRYNLNDCFNKIRTDLKYLKEQRVFDFYYITEETDSRGQKHTVNTWQSALQEIVNVANLDYELTADTYNDAVAEALLHVMDILRTDRSFRPLEKYERPGANAAAVSMDRVIFLTGGLHAAKNDSYNETPSFTDPLRGPYYYGEKDMYSLETVNRDFDIGLTATDYIVVFVACLGVIYALATMLLNVIARIFNLIFLYVISPPILALRPLDNGARTKQWLTGFIVTSLGIFGNVIAMRLLLIYLPIVVDPNLVLFPNSVLLNYMAKVLLILGGYFAAEKAVGLWTGILSETAGMTAAGANDMGAQARGMVSQAGNMATGAAGRAGRTMLGAATGGLSLAARPLKNLGSRAYGSTVGKAVSAWSSLGAGDVAGRKAEESAKERLAADKAYERLRTGEGGGGPQQPVQPPLQNKSGSKDNVKDNVNGNAKGNVKDNRQPEQPQVRNYAPPASENIRRRADALRDAQRNAALRANGGIPDAPPVPGAPPVSGAGSRGLGPQRWVRDSSGRWREKDKG